MRNNRRRRRTSPIYTFAVTWALLSLIFPIYRIGGILLILGLSSLASYLAGLAAARSANREEQTAARETPVKQAPVRETSVKEAPAKAEPVRKAAPVKKSYGPEIDPIIEEGNKALSEMGRLYMSIKDDEVKRKINEIMRITDKIVQDAIEDPDDIPQIKKFMNYYLPTTIKLLNAYDRMSTQGIEGENLDKSMNSINEMLDTAIAAYKKRLDSLFENQALDIETDIEVMNAMLAREGLAGGKDFVTEGYERKD